MTDRSVVIKSQETMKPYLLLLLLIGLGGSSLYAQFGLRAQYGFADFSADASIQDIVESQHGIDIGLHYWFRLKNKRLEFFPEISYAALDQGQSETAEALPYTYRRIGVRMPARIYPLDFASDCDCPTFSKQNDLIQKGFFVEVAPGYFYDQSSISLIDREDSHGQAEVSVGVGLDIGINDLITVTPQVSYAWGMLGPEEGISLQNVLRAGLSVTLRPDY